MEGKYFRKREKRIQRSEAGKSLACLEISKAKDGKENLVKDEVEEISRGPSAIGRL